MREALEEILEAVWGAEETDSTTMESIRAACPIPVNEEDVAALVSQQLLVVEQDRAQLTEQGRQQARSIVRRHRLAETLFATILDLDPQERESVACQAEHTLLPEVEEAICILLGHPTVCPDNRPIPPGRCCREQQTQASSVVVSLAQLHAGERGRITFIKPQNHQRLHRLASFGLTPGTVIALHQTSPAYCIRYEGTELAIDAESAKDIYVTRMS